MSKERLLELRGNKGFTLIELLVVIAIVGILSAIAIPQYAAYQRQGFERQVTADLKNAAIAQESYYADSEVYRACVSCTTADLPGFRKTPDVSVDSVVVGQTFTLTGKHTKCGADIWTYSSITGSVTPPLTPC